MSLTTWLMSAWTGTPPKNDHDRLILLEQRLDLTVEQVRRELAEAALNRTHIAERLDAGNRQFNDLDLYKQRTDEALADVRGQAGSARLAADNAGRAVDALSRAMDQQTGALDRKIDKSVETLEELLDAKIAAAVAPLKEQIEKLKETQTTWSTQGRLLRTMVAPGLAIGMTIVTTLVMKWLFP